GRATIDDDMLDELEEVLITSDVGVATTEKIIKCIQERVRKEKSMPAEQLQVLLRDEIAQMLVSHGNEDSEEIVFPKHEKGPHVIMVVGVNGVGKTTTIGKIAYQLNQQGKKVVLGAADTFRAAAIDQLKVWAERSQVEIVAQTMGADPAAVAFDTLQSAVAKNADVVIIDTAGRLHNKVNLMNELTKIKRVMQKVIANAPHDVMLVLDGSTGQNAFEQARQFTAATEVTSLAITKIDGTAKGGVVIGISDQFNIPVRFIGVGEKAGDLQVFNRFEFVDSLFANQGK
ncbi:MAG: signal recognition particle-docking protein FtsY, partial [Bacteroidota bacterium]